MWLPVRRAGASAQHDKRIQNRDAWETGLAGLPNAQEARNIVMSDDKVRALIAAAYNLDHQLGLLTDTLGDHRRPSEPSRPPPRRGSAQSPPTAEADDAEVGQGWRQKPRREKDRALFRPDHPSWQPR